MRRRVRWLRLRWFVSWRRSVADPVPSVLKQTFTVAAVLSLMALLLEAPAGLVEKSINVVAFAVAAFLASTRRVRLAAVLSVLAVTVSSAALSFRLGSSPHGILQLTALVLMPFVAVVATLGDVRVVVLSGAASFIGAVVVSSLWGLDVDDRVLLGFAMGMGTVVAVATAVVLAESKRQALHDLRVARRKEQRLRHSEEKRVTAERMAFAANLASKLSHELNNPLAFSLANLRFVTEAVRSGDPEVQAAVTETTEGLERIRAIVERMSLFHAAGSPPTTTDLEGALKELVEERRARGRAIVLSLGEGTLPAIALDPRRLARVVGVPLDNALEVTREGQRVVLRVENGSRFVRVVVEDDGPGFPPGFEARLAEPGIATAGKLGLGLPLARELMRSIGGELHAENRAEGGARVALEFPSAT
jgi:signal transduction histidine kinase